MEITNALSRPLLAIAVLVATGGLRPPAGVAAKLPLPTLGYARGPLSWRSASRSPQRSPQCSQSS